MTTKPVWKEMSANLITIGWNETMAQAYRRMKNKGIRHLPVLQESGEVIGILSDRDVQRSMISDINRSAGYGMSDETIEFDPESRVRDYMSWPVQVVDRDTEIKDVAKKMREEKISSVLVSTGGQVCGIVTAEDLLAVLIELLKDPASSKTWQLGHLLDEASASLSRSLI